MDLIEGVEWDAGESIMWIFTTVGFFSVVQKPGDRRLCVRARAACDLERLRATLMTELGPTTDAEGTDSPFRARIDREVFARGLASLGWDIIQPFEAPKSVHTVVKTRTSSRG